jgi:hypothetical protein
VNTKTIYKDIPAVRITAPTNLSSTATNPLGVGFALTTSSATGGANQTSIPAGTTCTIAVNGGAPAATTSLLATFSSNQKTLVSGSNTIAVACTNASGTGTSTVSVNLVAPTLTITSTNPVSNVGATLTTAVATRINSLTFATIPAGDVCSYKVNGGSAVSYTNTTIAANTIAGLVVGTNNVVFSCTNAAGTGSVTLVVNRTS